MTTTSTPKSIPAGRPVDQLIERARIAYSKSGGREQPSSASDVTEIDGKTIITLRNTNGVLAAYQLHGDALKRQVVVTAEVDQLFATAFAGPRDPRSAEYKAGARAALEFRINGTSIPRPYAAGTAAEDAFYAGIAEGHAIWRRAQAEAAGIA